MRGDKLYEQARILHQKLYSRQYRRGKEEEKAYKLYFLALRNSAYLRHPEAQYEFGQQFEDIGFMGMNNPNYNPKKAVYWYTKASLQNHAAACNNLAHHYELGIGCQKNLNKAFALYKKSAELGYQLGKNNLRIMKRQMLRVK